MQTHYAEALCRRNLLRPFTGFRLCASRPLQHFPSAAVRFSFNLSDRDRRPQCWKQRAGRYETIRAKKKDNVWSIDNELASKKAAEETKGLKRRRKMRKKVKDSGRSGDSTVMVSGAMLTEVETVLQTQVLEYIGCNR